MQHIDLNHKNILITGAAGFIGSNLALRLLGSVQEATVVGIDCMTDYNPVELKEYRLGLLNGRDGFHFSKTDITDFESLEKPELDRKNQQAGQ